MEAVFGVYTGSVFVPEVTYACIDLILSKIMEDSALAARLTGWEQILRYEWQIESGQTIITSCVFDSNDMQIKVTHNSNTEGTLLQVAGQPKWVVKVHASADATLPTDALPNVVTAQNIKSVSIIQRRSLNLRKCTYHFDMVWTGKTKDEAEKNISEHPPLYSIKVAICSNDINYMCKKAEQCWCSATNLPCQIKHNMS